MIQEETKDKMIFGWVKYCNWERPYIHLLI